MPRPRDFRGRKGAWLSPRQNSGNMSGGLSKAKYERLSHPVSQNTILYMEPVSNYVMHLLVVVSL